MRLASLLPLFLLACSGSTDGSDPDGTDKDKQEAEVTIELLSPSEGEEFPYGESVPLHVEAKRNGNPVAIESATWTVGGWTGTGKETEATGLEPGAKTVEVEAVVGGETYTASVGITIAEPVVYTYSGTFEARVVANIDGLGEFEDTCRTTIGFTVDAGVLAGSGVCAVFDEYDFEPLSFMMEGTVGGGAVEGDLVMSLDGSEARTPFSGTGRSGQPLEASFDTTHRSGDGSVRIVGTWSASPG